MNKSSLLSKFYGCGKISVRFRNINIAIFLVVSILIGAVAFFILCNVVDTVAKDYARLYSANTVGILNTYLRSEIALIRKAGNSPAVKGWFANERDPKKKLAAYTEMMEIINVLSSGHLYLGIEKSLHEFTVEKGFPINNIRPHAVLRPDYFDDAWYFAAAASDKEYLLNVDIDKVLRRKRVWLNYKVTDSSGGVLGVLSTGLDFSALVGKLFAEYDARSVRGLVIDEKGIIHMDSALLDNEGFLHYSIGGERHIGEDFRDAALLSAVSDYTKAIDGYFDVNSVTTVIEMSGGPYRYATIAPISSTTWSVVTFYDASSLFRITEFLPILFIIVAMFIVFIATTGFTSAKLIFVPFKMLISSIEHTKINRNEYIYGIDRDDEIGVLANTVQNMRDNLIDALNKAHYDALTGIYNRRFLKENLNHLIQTTSRAGGTLSVMVIDVDFFKGYNDTYGHSEGDVCLKKIAVILSGGILRAKDFVARYGGEEFVIVLPNTNETGARILANKLLEDVRSCNIHHKTSDVATHVTISIGVTTGNAKHTQSGEDYIRRADEALYLSKQNGRNRYTFLKLDGEDIRILAGMTQERKPCKAIGS